MDSSKSYGAQLEPKKNKKINSGSGDSRFESAATAVDSSEGPEIELGVDELCLIFENDWISAGDLLGFRMVKTSWRDAATTTLLKRDAFYVNLYLKNENEEEDEDEDPSTGEPGEQPPSSENLNQLTELISTSPKFPTTTFSIYTSTIADVNHTNFPDLLKYFKLHGEKIRTLRLHGGITQKLLLDIFTIYTPSLSCLDLSKGQLSSQKAKTDDEDEDHYLNLRSNALPITSLVLGDTWHDYYYPDPDPDSDPTDSENDDSSSNATETERDIFHWLLSSPSKLICIENVTVDTLLGVLEEGKGHLIRSFDCSLFEYSRTYCSQIMTQLVALKPSNLSTVTLDMEYVDVDVDVEWGEPLDIALVNSFILSIKDTVQDFTFCFKYEAHNWNSKVQIPQMKKLKSMTIIGNAVDESKRRGGLFDLHSNFIQFQDGISAQDYFPSLKNISLYFMDDDGGARDTEEANLMSFFRFKSRGGDENGSVWDSLPKVDMLDTDWDVVAGMDHVANEATPQYTLLREMFPNIRILKIRCDDLFLLEPFCWIICPKVEFMEIYEIQSFRAAYEDEDNEYELSHYVDRFFTGFPLEICHKLRATQLSDEAQNPDLMEFLRVSRPSICQRKHLKELKLQFGAPFWSEFASAVTGVNAFLKMPNTKFIISYNSEIFRWRPTGDASRGCKEELYDADILAAEELCFGLIKPYVQIVHELCTNYY